MNEERARYLDPNDWSIGPCWHMRDCSAQWREGCPVWQYQAGEACWEVGGTYCQGKLRNTRREKEILCYECDVFRSMQVEPKK